MAPDVVLGDGEVDRNTVFIDTSLDTRLAMILSESETVSDFKKKIVFEHRQMFPAIGDIKIECLKVKKRGNFYNLIDSMPVKCAFNATQRILFLSADASRSEQNDGIQHPGEHTAGDQLALPWVTHSRLIERLDNHGSPSNHSKIVSFENQKVVNADQLTSGDSCKDVSKNVEEDRSYNDKHLDHELQEKLYTGHTEDISSKKRTRDVSNESSLKADFESGPSVKKKRKTQRVKRDVKASEENIASTYDDDDKVNDKGASIINEVLFDFKSKGKDLGDENNRINEGEKCSDLDQLATAGTGIEVIESENIGDVAMVMENNSQKEMPTGISQQEKDSELARKSAAENEMDSSLMRTPDSEHDAAEVTATGHMKRSRKHKAVEKGVFYTSFTKKLHIESSSQQDVGSNGQECADDQIDTFKDDSEVSLKQRPELKLPEMKKGNMGCENIGGKKRQSKKRFKHSDNLLGDISSTVSASILDERKTNEDSEKTLIDDKKGDDVSMNEAEVSVEKSRREFTDANDAQTVTNEENLLPNSESVVNNDAEKQNEKADDTIKKKKKKKSKKSALRNEDESITKDVDGDIFENVKDDRKDGDMPSTSFDSIMDERKTNEDSGKLLLDAKKGDDVIVNEVDISVENMEKKSGEEFKDTNDVATVTNGESRLPHSESVMNNDADVSTEKMEDTMKKKKKKKMKTKKSAGRNEDESIAKNAICDVCENVKEGESSLPDADRNDGDTSFTVFDSVNDEKQMNEVSGKLLLDAKKGDGAIVNELDVSVENMGKKLGEEFEYTNDVATEINEENRLPHSESLMTNDVEVSIEKTEDTMKKKKKTKRSSGRNEDESMTTQVDGDICENVKEGESSLPDADRKDNDTSLTVFDSVSDEKQMNEVSGKSLLDADKVDVILNEVIMSVENMEGKWKELKDVASVTNEENNLAHSESLMNDMKKKKISKNSAGGNEDESIANHAKRDACENVKEDGCSFSDGNRKDCNTSLMILASVLDEMNNNSGKTSTGADKGDDVVIANDVATVTNEEITTGENIRQVNEQFEIQNEKMNDTTKKNKTRKTRKSAQRIEDESLTKHVNRDISENVKDGESKKSQDLPSKHQFTEVELESMKSQSVDHHLPEKTLTNVAASEVPELNNKIDVLVDASVDYLAPGHQPKKNAIVHSRKVKDMKKTKDDSRKDQSQKLASKTVKNKVSSNVLKEPSITNNDRIKTRQTTKIIDAQKTNKQQSSVGQAHVKTVQKKSMNSLVKSLLNAPGTIFWDDSDDNATTNSDSSTHTPSEKSSSSSSLGESSYIMQSRINRSHAKMGREVAGKKNINSERGKLNYRLRSASSFKKIKESASSQVEDTESQPVDFVPDSQPVGK